MAPFGARECTYGGRHGGGKGASLHHGLPVEQIKLDRAQKRRDRVAPSDEGFGVLLHLAEKVRLQHLKT